MMRDKSRDEFSTRNARIATELAKKIGPAFADRGGPANVQTFSTFADERRHRVSLWSGAVRPRPPSVVARRAVHDCHSAIGGSMPQRVLITGGAGFIGSHLADELLS